MRVGYVKHFPLLGKSFSRLRAEVLGHLYSSGYEISNTLPGIVIYYWCSIKKTSTLILKKCWLALDFYFSCHINDDFSFQWCILSLWHLPICLKYNNGTRKGKNSHCIICCLIIYFSNNEFKKIYFWLTEIRFLKLQCWSFI